MNLDLLTGAQKRSATRVLEQECARRHHLVVYLSGSHAYGFPSPDSDVDLKSVHIAPTSSLVGLGVPTLHADRLEVIMDVEIDYTSNELGSVLSGIIAGNGNYIERILGRLCVIGSPELTQLRPLVKDVLSRKLYKHYAGFARNQYKAAFESGTSFVPAKKALYVLRTALTGTHLLRTGDLVIDVRSLIDEYGFSHARQLIERKRAGERVSLDDKTAERWRTDLTGALEGLERARDASCLPQGPEEIPNHIDALAAWLLSVRKVFW